MPSTIAAADMAGTDVILVNAADEEVGRDFKASAHRGAGVLHRAFSVYVFDSQARLLLQRRSALKPLWPGYWSNSCCSHPRPGEATRDAASRRLREELGLANVRTLCFLFKFRYFARYDHCGAEHEICSVFAAVADRAGRLDRREIADVRYAPADLLDEQLKKEPEQFTPWLKIAWMRIRADHWASVDRLVSQAAA